MSATAAKIQSTVTQKTENQDSVGKNWSFEIWKITGDGSDTTVDVTTALTNVRFASICNIDNTANSGIGFSQSGTTVTLTCITAVANGKFALVKIEGWA